MKKLLLVILLALIIFLPSTSFAQEATATPTPSPSPTITPTPIVNPVGGNTTSTQPTPPLPCVNLQGEQLSCPPLLREYYSTQANGEKCVDTYAQFQEDPRKNHYWVEDPEITAQWRADERARQFIYWVLNQNSLDNNPTFRQIWSFSSNISYVFILLVVAVMGLRHIIGQRLNFQTQIKLWPSAMKIGGLLLYIALSFSIIVTMIQISDIMMRFFIDNVGGRNLFNIYGVSVSDEKNYANFVGCRDMNIRVNESADAELFLLKVTNITYYVMGTMLILRKIVLWFLMFVSPFLAILLPFVFIRNIGFIWIGVFFQWLFYGPLLAIFLGAMVSIWRNGLPFIFNFATDNDVKRYIYPTAISILYGGPAQVGERGLSALNNGNYVDTFVEYVITLIMLWAVILLPWWLLRIFRDYCCDGIYAMKNILLSMYDQSRGGPLPPAPPTAPAPIKTSTTINVQKPVDTSVPKRIETIEEIRKVKTEELTKNLNLSATKLTDIAQFEMNKQLQKETVKNIEYLKNPTQAQTPQERQKYMNIRSELFNRAIKEDKVARQILSVTSNSQIDQRVRKEQLIKYTTQTVSPAIAQAGKINVTVNLPKPQVTAATSSFVNSVVNNNSVVNTISQSTKVSQPQVQQILQTYTQHIEQPLSQVITTISKQTNISQDKINNVLKHLNTIVNNSQVVNQTATKEQVPHEKVVNVVQSINSTTNQDNRAISSISQQVGLPAQKLSSIVNSYFNTVNNNSTIMNQVTQQTGTQPEQTKTIMNLYTQYIDQPYTVATEKIGQTVGLAKEKVHEVLQLVTNNILTTQSVEKDTIIHETATKEQISHEQVTKVIQSLQTVLQPTTDQHPVTVISQAAALPEQKVTSIMNTFFNTVTNNSTVMNELEQQTETKPDQIKNVLTMYAQFIDQPYITITEKINQALGISKEKVNHIIATVSNNIATSKSLVKTVAEMTHLPEHDIETIISQQIPVMEAEQHIEKSITIPASISIEDYEEVKGMWTKQYEKGEVPVTDNIQTRNDWIEQDIVFITNTLNKLLAEDEKTRLTGLDDVGYILPIFMINNLKGEELLVYLKAKLEAAKSVKTSLEKEKEITEKLKSQEELVDVAAPKSEEQQKTMEMKEELPLQENDTSDDDKQSKPN